MIITIDLEGGLVQSVHIDQECDVEVRVRDYDIEGLADNETYIDNNGVQYDLSVRYPEIGAPAEVLRKTTLPVTIDEDDPLELNVNQLSRLALALAPHSDAEVCIAPGILCAYCPLKASKDCSNASRVDYLKKQET